MGIPVIAFNSFCKIIKTEKDEHRKENPSIAKANNIMVLTNFNGAGIGFGFGVGCGFGVGWGFGGMPVNILGLGIGGGCGVGLGLGWGFGTAFGSKYRTSRVTFQGMEFDKKDHSDGASFKELSKSTQEVRASQ